MRRKRKIIIEFIFTSFALFHLYRLTPILGSRAQQLRPELAKSRPTRSTLLHQELFPWEEAEPAMLTMRILLDLVSTSYVCAQACSLSQAASPNHPHLHSQHAKFFTLVT